MKNRKITILASGFGLGLYIPGLLIERQLKERNIPAEVAVFENLLSEDKREQVIKSKSAYHKKFALALMSSRMPMDIREGLNPQAVEALLNKWNSKKRRDFIVLSGHWLHVVDLYRERLPASEKLHVDILYVDCDLPPSWTSLKQYNPDYSLSHNEICLYDYENKNILYTLPIGKQPPVPYRKRPERFVVHGGGWGMGTYKDKIPELERKGFSLDVVAYEMQEADHGKAANRYFIIDPSWSAWKQNNSPKFEFPPLGQIQMGKEPEYKNNDEYHELFEITRNARAVIGKPGAGTLMDSFSAATPIVMLEPFGEHERKNTELWEQLGFGITYRKWIEHSYSMEILESLHDNLLSKRNSYESFIDFYIKKRDLG